ncbi:MAG TPA: hypothetical protein VFP54_10725 [Acidimicrobiales bacterium]|nr:hypothetical protein [Acidimicrobiales bacterium]
MRPLDGNWGRRRRGRGRGWGGGRRASLPSLGLVAAVIGVIVLLGVIGVIVQLVRGVPAVSARATAPSSVSVPGSPPAMPFPPEGEAAVGIMGVGTIAASGGNQPVPIASITKVMTAYVLLNDHPLAPGQQGPSITLTATDVANYQAGLAGQQSVVKVEAGEKLTELQALQGLLIPSANDLATALANWDAGSVPAFLAKMNSTAAQMGMSHTHFTDVIGLDATTVSTASDLMILGQKAMANQVLASIVGQKQVDLPVAGMQYNTDYILGRNGVIGIKTGSSSEAGGTFLFAANAAAAGKPAVVIGSVLGQKTASELQSALSASAALIAAAPGAVQTVTVLPAGTRVATIHVPWGHDVAVVTTKPVSVLGWPGLTFTEKVRLRPVGRGTPAGTEVATVELASGGSTVTVPAATTTAIGSPGLAWRIVHG